MSKISAIIFEINRPKFRNLIVFLKNIPEMISFKFRYGVRVIGCAVENVQKMDEMAPTGWI